MTQTVFKRYEFKYHLTKQQYRDLLQTMNNHMKLDKYGKHKISNIYFDTMDYRIIRHSIEKPKYKEKLRLRIYGEPEKEAQAYIELKKKFKGVVYKRRLTTTQHQAMNYLTKKGYSLSSSQILKEIEYFIHSNEQLYPRVYLAYNREAYYSEEDGEFRMTFDSNIKMRDINISLKESEYDRNILDEDSVLLEVKTVSALPFWFINFLSDNEIMKVSFSKYGTAYKKVILPKLIDNYRGVVHE